MDLTLISAKHTLATDVKYNQVKCQILDRIDALRLRDGKYKFDANLLNLVCELVEYLIVKSDKVDKKALVLDIMNDIFGLSDYDKTAVGNSIEFLHKSKLIKKVSYFKLFCTGLREFLGKKK